MTQNASDRDARGVVVVSDPSAMSDLLDAAAVEDPEPYFSSLRPHSSYPCSSEPSTSDGNNNSKGTPRFISTPVRTSTSTTGNKLLIAEDVVGFTGGSSVYRVDWALKNGNVPDNQRHVAVESRSHGDTKHSFNAIGDAVGPGLIQVWRLDVKANTNTSTGKETSTARKKQKTKGRQQSSTSRVDSGITQASMVLGLAHNAKHCFDVKWKKQLNQSTASKSLGDLAVALGNGRVEVWRVPLIGEGDTPLTAPQTQVSNKTPVIVTCAPTFTGVAPKNVGVPLCLDWANHAPFERLVAGTSSGAVVLWTVLLTVDSTSKSNDVQLPVLQIASTGCPQRCVKWAPVDETSKNNSYDSSFLLMSGGHGMTSPVIYDTRDPFNPVCGRRSGNEAAFGGSNTVLACDWTHNGAVCSGADTGQTNVHDFFHDERFSNPRGDVAPRIGVRAIDNEKDMAENTVEVICVDGAGSTGNAANNSNTSRKSLTNNPSLRVDVGAVWSVDSKPTGKKSITSLLVSGTGRAGVRTAIVACGNGLRKGKAIAKARKRALPVDFGFIGGTAVFLKQKGGNGRADGASYDGLGDDSSAEDDAPVTPDNPAGTPEATEIVPVTDVSMLLRDATAKRETLFDTHDVLVVPASRGASGVATVKTNQPSKFFETQKHVTFAPVRSAVWLDSSVPVADDSNNCWCVWGDDSGFLRFQRLDGEAVARSAEDIAETETNN